MLKVETVLTADNARNDHALRHSIAVVIDVLRATTTMCRAFESGAHRIIPVASEEAARELAIGMKNTEGASMHAASVLLCGERKGVKPDGFDLGNSPHEYTRDRVRHKTLIFTTTNGTRALERTRNAALQLIVGFVNIRAVTEEIFRHLRTLKLQTTPIQRILLVCAGTEGAPSLEDTLCAGAMLDALLAEEPSLQPDETSFSAFKHYASFESEAALHHAIFQSPHGLYLSSLGFAADIVVAAERDTVRFAPHTAHDEEFSYLRVG